MRRWAGPLLLMPPMRLGGVTDRPWSSSSPTVGVCSAPILQSTSSEAALERCGPALVGHGSFRADVQLGKEVLATGKILAFNSRLHGKQQPEVRVEG